MLDDLVQLADTALRLFQFTLSVSQAAVNLGTLLLRDHFHEFILMLSGESGHRADAVEQVFFHDDVSALTSAYALGRLIPIRAESSFTLMVSFSISQPSFLMNLPVWATKKAEPLIVVD